MSLYPASFWNILFLLDDQGRELIKQLHLSNEGEDEDERYLSVNKRKRRDIASKSNNGLLNGGRRTGRGGGRGRGRGGRGNTYNSDDDSDDDEESIGSDSSDEQSIASNDLLSDEDLGDKDRNNHDDDDGNNGDDGNDDDDDNDDNVRKRKKKISHLISRRSQASIRNAANAAPTSSYSSGKKAKPTSNRTAASRLRSRNHVIDNWLGDEDGSDAYADLENFLVE